MIRIETGCGTLGENAKMEHPDAAAGDFVWLAVTDDGSGMDHETLEKIFDPFFTTKAPGHGTGLGLAMVRDMVRQSNGLIAAHSEPGQGTSIRIWLPRHAAPDEERKEGDHGDMQTRDSSCGGE